MTKTAAQDIKNRLKSSIAFEKVEKSKRKEMHGQSTGTLKDHQQIKKYPWCRSVAQH